MQSYFFITIDVISIILCINIHLISNDILAVMCSEIKFYFDGVITYIVKYRHILLHVSLSFLVCSNDWLIRDVFVEIYIFDVYVYHFNR